MGMNRLEIFIFVVIPESANNLISHMMFMFEYNVRHGTVIGLVGAGGIGWHISNYLKFLQYDKVLALLIVIFLTVVVIDLSSQFVRSYFNENNDARNKTWLSVFLPACRFIQRRRIIKLLRQCGDSRPCKILGMTLFSFLKEQQQHHRFRRRLPQMP